MHNPKPEPAVISVIIPTLNEARLLAATVQRARQDGVREIIVVDGGSTDTTRAIAAPVADRVLSAPCGRALQMNAGAACASGDILLFLHADTWLPQGFADSVRAACAAPGVIGGRFDVRLEPSSPLLWLTGELINVRSRLSRIATGDQAIFIRRSVFEQLGGYAAIPLMEDIDLTRRMKHAGRIACLRARAITSSRRWQQAGTLRTIVLMWTLRALYFCNVSPERLQRVYRHAR
jgi:rSAM/selenodomain-associated transferase 2